MMDELMLTTTTDTDREQGKRNYAYHPLCTTHNEATVLEIGRRHIQMAFPNVLHSVIQQKNKSLIDAFITAFST